MPAHSEVLRGTVCEGRCTQAGWRRSLGARAVGEPSAVSWLRHRAGARASSSPQDAREAVESAQAPAAVPKAPYGLTGVRGASCVGLDQACQQSNAKASEALREMWSRLPSCVESTVVLWCLQWGASLSKSTQLEDVRVRRVWGSVPSAAKRTPRSAKQMFGLSAKGRS